MSGDSQKLGNCTEIFVTINANRLQLHEIINNKEQNKNTILFIVLVLSSFYNDHFICVR
jgi:hypothetical protein